ncbi:SulP family inorganic anion transporter [Pseudoduganella ginsengisoli]|uniref:STAS domain-containing protein n=1 Tax=Pseudoduganella ginsengisoli TaxID=1462440 RepID=A0A6L6Q5U2_9BURK|nr:SulP family inorganic anion transporter [Pseudoduganella ginsengisoli]MTW05127.1 STAS domain-containing protein [Pseudoduganella ginsengisoli]
MISILEARSAGLFGPGKILPNIVSGVIVGVVALPLSMAFAIASGARPEQGLYTAIVAGALVSALGGSRTQIAGPTGAFIAILASITARYGVDGLQLATLMAGVILLLMGLTKLGGIIKFIPAPVIVGFTTGIAVIIWVGQWRYFFGLPAVPDAHFHVKLWHLLQLLPALDPATTAIGVASLVLTLAPAHVPGLRKVPGPLVALTAATVAQYVFGFKGVATIGSAFGGIPQQLPALTLPDISVSRMIELTGPAFAIAMLGAIESLLSAVVADGMAGTRHDSNQELVGQGIANICSPLLGGFAATGAIARTATNIRYGGSSPLAGIVHAATLLVIIVLLAPMAAYVPLATLAAILFVVAFNMSEIRHFLRMLRIAPRADGAILLITCLLTVLTDLVVAVNIGVILATLRFMQRMAASVDIQRQTDEHLESELQRNGLQQLPAGVLVYAIEGPFFFGAVENFERALGHTHTDPHILVLRLERVPFIDMTGLLTLEEVVRHLKRRGVHVVLCGANELVQRKLERIGLLDVIGRGNCVPGMEQALQRTQALQPAG